jgi:hypothetical protein
MSQLGFGILVFGGDISLPTYQQLSTPSLFFFLFLSRRQAKIILGILIVTPT